MKRTTKQQSINAALVDSIDLQNMQTGKISANVGYPHNMSGVTRKLTKREIQQQLNLQRG
jgi:hypothetical protein